MVEYTYTLNASEATTTGVDIGIGGTAVYVQGEDVTLEFTVHETTDHSTTLDISSASGIEWVLANTDGTEELTKTKSGDIAFTTDGTDGKVDVPVNQTDTSGLDAGSFRHQLTITDDGSGNQTVTAQGDFEITGSET